MLIVITIGLNCIMCIWFGLWYVFVDKTLQWFCCWLVLIENLFSGKCGPFTRHNCFIVMLYL